MGRSRNDGRGKTGGRKPGTPNKVNSDLKQWVRDILESGQGQFQEDLAMLEPAERVKTYTGLLGYVIPKMASVSVEDALAAEYRRLEQLLHSAPDEAIDKIVERINNLKNENGRKRT